MKIKNIGKAAALALTALAMVHCSDWTETESETIFEHGLTESNKSEEYYKALREWKKTDHAISFGWFSGWGEPATNTTNMLMGIPDSMDIVSLWGQWTNLTPRQASGPALRPGEEGYEGCILQFHLVRGTEPHPCGVRCGRGNARKVLGLG